MRTLDEARATCETYLPGLCDDLSSVSLAELEAPGGPGLQMFRTANGPGLLIPKHYAGLAATPLDAVRVTRAIGSYAPSLAVATTMHHFSVATLFTMADSLKSSGMEWALLEGIARENLLVSSGFAEGRPGQGILTPTMSATPTTGGFTVNGSKKPCSLSKSMDLMSASVAISNADVQDQLAILLIASDTPGISVRPFWDSNILAGAESDEVKFDNVFVDERLVVAPEAGDEGQLDQLQTVGFIWFEMLISSAYLGMATGLVQRVFVANKASARERAALVVRLETAALLLEGVARILDEDVENSALATSLIARYGAQDAINDAVSVSVELLGGIAFIRSPDVGYLASACQCLGFHPPSRSASAETLNAYFDGDLLKLA